MKNYEPVEKQHMSEAKSGALIFWLAVIICILIIV